MQILVYGHRKTEDMAWMFDTVQQQEAAWLRLFEQIDDDWGYTDLELDTLADDEIVEPKGRGPSLLDQRRWYRAAKVGDWTAAKQLVNLRKDHGYEYEDEWRFMEVENPIKRASKQKR